MKKIFNLTLAFAAGLSTFAADSPYQGSEPIEGGKYYLYQVETKQWLQANMSEANEWTTHAELGSVGMEVQLLKPEGLDFEGFQIYCNFTNNGELNGTDEDRFFLDQAGRDLCDWILEKTDGGYKIHIKARGEESDTRNYIAEDTYIGATDNGMFGGLSDSPTHFTWQFVSKDERFRVETANATASNPVDISWLIPWFDHGRNDLRERLWTISSETDGGGMGNDGLRGYPVQEYWHQCLMNQSITLSDLPTGTYGFSIQAFYRDCEGVLDGGVIDPEWLERIEQGTEVLDRVTYFAGAASAHPMSIYQDAKTSQQDGYTVSINDRYIPNSMSDSGYAMIDGTSYVNEYLKSPVTDGALTIGIKKTDRTHRDWLIYKRAFLRYYGSAVEAEDLTELKNQLSELIKTAEALPQTPTFITEIQNAQSALETATSSNTLLSVINALDEAIKVIRNSADNINAYFATVELGWTDSTAEETFNAATTVDEYATAIKQLRYARRNAVAERHPDVFKGNAPAEGKFYLYNVGRQQFFCGGSDWGAHAALGLPGVELGFTEVGEKQGYMSYLIETGLYNGPDNHYLSYRGYMDSGDPDNNGGFAFIPVEGKEGVYNMVQADYQDVHVQWDPYASTDTGNSDETTVGTECRNLDPTNPYAQWKLVTRAEREELLESATLENPADATFMIKSPGFNNREDAGTVWETNDFNIWEYGANHYDFVMESFDTEAGASVNQMIENLPVGVYVATVQGFYRNGEWEDQPDLEQSQNAVFYADMDEVKLPNIMSETGNAPGEGRKAYSEDGTEYDVPGGTGAAVMATNFFKAGLYKTVLVFEKTDSGDLALGVEKTDKGEELDWIVVDNFRLHYYGNDTTVEEVRAAYEEEASGVESIEEEAINRTFDDRIFNIHGVQVVNPTIPGIYIQNGKKFIVR